MASPALTEGDLQLVLRASGYLTNGQAWDLAEVLAKLIADGDVEAARRAAEKAAEDR